MTRVFENRPEGATTPTGWPSIPLKYLFRRSKTLGTGEERLLSIYRDYGVIPKDSRDDNFNKPSDDLSKYQVVSQGDLVVNKMKAWQGSVAVSEYDGIISPAYFVYRPMGVIDGRFAHYLLRSNEYFQYYASISSGVRPNQWDLDPRAFERLEVTIPSHEEQHAIADYLDRETAEIDAALAEHKHLRALLLERRAETITAATRPSNPELKEAPLVRLRHVTSLNPSPRLNISPDSAQLFPLFSMDSISEFGPLHPPVLRPYSELATGYSYLEPTDVAYAKVTPCFENGKGLVGAELDGPSFATTELTVLRPAPEVDQNYLALVLQSADFHAVGEASMTGAGGLKRVSEHAACNYRFLLPDKKTQIRIVEQVRLEADETDALISDSNRLSDLLLERRAALISAAVTGQIDVAARGASVAEQLRDELEVHV